MSHLVTKRVFDESESGRFSMNETRKACWFRPPSRPRSRRTGCLIAHAWGGLLRYARTGALAYHEVFGLPFWQDLDAHPQVAESFDALIGPARSLGTSNSAKLKPIPSSGIHTSAG